MSWSDPLHRSAPGRGLRAGLLLALALAVAGCGFQPLYGRAGPTGETATTELAAVRIAPLADRIGQKMHNLLRDRLNPRGQPRDPAYLLQVGLTETRKELGIRKDETATRANLILTASFTLREMASNRPLLHGSATSINSYNILDNQFATAVSEDNARTRALRELSDDIRTRLAVFFAQSPARASSHRSPTARPPGDAAARPLARP
ncbi:MAG: LPS assembly lipoprotein LptE [Kiloniellaceae bacterium]